MNSEVRFPFPVTPEEAGRGRLISFISSRAGSGASTLACLAAISLSSMSEVALIDFNPESKVRSYMGYPADVSSASILDINGVDNPESIISAGECFNSSQLKVFPGTIKTLDSCQISAALHQKACCSLKQVFGVTVACMGPLYSSSWAGLLLSDEICLVVTPSRASMDVFRDQMETLARLGLAQRTRIILNQLGYPGSIERKGAEAYFHPDILLAYDRKLAGNCNRRNLELSASLGNSLCSIFHEPGKQTPISWSLSGWRHAREALT